VKNLSVRTKLLGALLGVGLLTLLVTGWQADRRAEAALRQAAINHLTSIREERRLQIEQYFVSVRRDALRLAESREITAAMREFKAAHRAFATEVARWPQAQRDRDRADVERYYASSFIPRLRVLGAGSGTATMDRYLPTDDVAMALQALFIADNPNQEGSRDRLDRPAAGRQYAEVHAQWNPFIRSTVHREGYDDLFLIDEETGQIVYTVAKKPDFATSLLTGPYRNGGLSRAFQEARETIDSEFVQLVDFESYPPSLGAPEAFVAAPIFSAGRRVGIVALEIPVRQIDAVMTGERKWEDRGLGRTGETYLVGSDYRMRSDSRFLLETPEEYLGSIAATGVPKDLIQLMQAYRSTVLFQPITTLDAQAALGGQTGTRTLVDYRG